MNSLNALKRQIHIVNEYQRVAAPILEHVKSVCKQFIGKKITTLNGLSSRLYDALKYDYKLIDVKPIPGTRWANVHYVSVSTSTSGIQVEISLCFSIDPTGCTYEKRTWYFGEVENGILKTVNDDYKVDINPLDFDQEVAAIKKFRELEAVMDEAKDKIRIGREIYSYIQLTDLE